MTLNEVMKETADAIREKKGTSELIKPVDFATEIKGITSGGGGDAPSGESDWVFMRAGSPDDPNADSSVAAFIALALNLPNAQSIAFIASAKLGCVAVRGDKYDQTMEKLGSSTLDGSAFKKGDYDLSAFGVGTIPLYSRNDFFNLIKLASGTDISNEVLEASIVEIPYNDVADYIYGIEF